ncbi:EF-hand domain-containing protein, partial [Klebsiella pneumoniae]
QMFHEMDKSGEGQLSVQELIDASTKFYKEKFSEEKAKSMVEFADVDKDGTLSVDEFLQIMFKDRDELGK